MVNGYWYNRCCDCILILFPIRKIFFRPKIEVDFQNKMPWIETKEVSNQSSSQDKRVLIRVRVTKIGKSVANDANLDVDAIFEKRDKSDVYVCSKSFMPMHIKDYRNASPTRIVPHLVNYFDIASKRIEDAFFNAQYKEGALNEE